MVVNGENIANGLGITPRLAERLLAAGADAVTLGNHTWRREEIGPYPRRRRRSSGPRISTTMRPAADRRSSTAATARRSR